MIRSVRKLAAMRREELLWRAAVLASRTCEEVGHWLRGSKRAYLNATVPARLLESGGFLLPDEAERRRTVDWIRLERPSYVERIRKEADRICDHRFVLLGREFSYESEVSWCADPVTGIPWPMRFHTRVPIFGGNRGYGDFKYVWELNRQQFLVTLGKAYSLTGERRYAEAIVALVRSWVGQNPYKVGVNWTSALEVAVRSIAWSWVYGFIRSAPSVDEESRRVLLGSLSLHGLYIEGHLSHYFSPYNHLVGEAAALFILGASFPYLEGAARWEQKGWGLLERILPEQFHEDGGSVEQASSYHHFTLGFYLQAALQRLARGDAVPERVWQRLESALEFSIYLTRPDGTMPMTGDGDEARSVHLGERSLWDYRPYLALGAALFGRRDMKTVGGALTEDALWLVGLAGLERYQSVVPEEPRSTVRAFPASGYAVMRTDWSARAHYLSFDFGEIAAGVSAGDVPSAAHGHADALSIEVSIEGRPVVVDPGFFTYNGNLEWHRYFRETAAHNTVVIDGLSQAEFRGRLKWSHGPRTRLHRWVVSSSFAYVEASHDGYARLAQPVLHRRTVVFEKPRYWLIRDELTGEGEHDVEQYFHLTPGRVVCDEGTGSVLTCCPSGGNLALVPAEEAPFAVRILENGEEPGEGWLATGYEKKTPAPVVRYHSRLRLPATLYVALVPFNDRLVETTVRVAPAAPFPYPASGQRVVVRMGSRQDVFVFSADGGLTEIGDGWLTDARVVRVRLDEHERVCACALVDGSLLIGQGRTVLRAEDPVRLAMVSFEGARPLIELSDRVGLSTCLQEPRIVFPSDDAELASVKSLFRSKSS